MEMQILRQHLQKIQLQKKDHLYEKTENQYPWFRVIQIFYALSTGWFAVFRIEYQLGKPLLIASALHNLCEWGMVCYSYFAIKSDRYRYFVIFLIWIWFVITFVTIVPKFPIYALAEQVSGIALDFLLPVTWFLIMRQQDNIDDKNMYKLACIAHTIHLFGTILPLVIENLIVGQSYYLSAFLEFCIFLTSGATHALYTVFAGYFQERVVAKYAHLPQWPLKYVLNGKLWLYLFIATVVGLLPTTIIPAAIGQCKVEK